MQDVQCRRKHESELKKNKIDETRNETKKDKHLKTIWQTDNRFGPLSQDEEEESINDEERELQEEDSEQNDEDKDKSTNHNNKKDTKEVDKTKKKKKRKTFSEIGSESPKNKRKTLDDPEEADSITPPPKPPLTPPPLKRKSPRINEKQKQMADAMEGTEGRGSPNAHHLLNENIPNQDENDEHDETDSDGNKTLISPTQTIVNLNFRPNVQTNLFTASTPKKKGTTMEATPTSPLGKSKETRERRSVSLDSRENRKGSK